jgi:DNA polymerase-1
VLCCGATAAAAFGFSSLKKALASQSHRIPLSVLTGEDPTQANPTVRVFSTYHPAYLLRNPAAGPSTEQHLRMLSDFLDGNLAMTLSVPSILDNSIAVAPDVPDYPITCLSLDIETYGILKGKSQRQFHPRKSEVWDHVRRSDLVVTVGLSWRDDPAGVVRSGIFDMGRGDHRRTLFSWLRHISSSPDFQMLLGQNLPFDLMYLRYAYPMVKKWLDHPLPIMDLMITNYLHDEGRPEKSLKSLAPLLRVTKYETQETGFRQYSSSSDPALWSYNCQDTAATLLSQERLEESIQQLYGESSQKLSPFCRRWYSDLLWLVVWMSENGIGVDELRLRAIDNHQQSRLRTLLALGQDYFGIPLKGKGSETAKRQVMDEAFDSLPIDRQCEVDLKLTPKKSEISFCVENRNAILNKLPRSAWVAPKLRLLGRFQDTAGILDRYTGPMLRGRTRPSKTDPTDHSTRIVDGLLYPRWYPVPSEFDDGSLGGTKQARIVAKGPPVQTFPPQIKACITTRFVGGHLIWFDYSQIELRVAALLSGDSAMMQEYRGKPDLHGKTACLMFGDSIKDHPQYKSLYRQAGKTFNFRMLYRGGALKAQQTLMADLGIFLEIARINEIDAAFWARHPGLRKWQDSLLDFVQKHGYYELPLIGQSRLFLGTQRQRDMQINEIVNLPVQAIAANIMLSAQFHLWNTLRTAGLRSLVPLNVYDAATVEAHRTELPHVLRMMEQVLLNPPYYVALCQHLGRSLPLAYEYSVDHGKKVEITG